MEELIDTQELRQVMKTKGVSARQLAGHLGISPSAIYAYLKGKRTPTVQHLLDICSLLEIDVSTLLPHNYKKSSQITENIPE